jgi:hypothetical protein
MAYDAARQRVVLFGGIAAGTVGVALADTWEWDGTAWLQRTPSTMPSGRHSHAMTYDVARQRIVMFGGADNLADTWEWDGSNWHAGPSGPLGRSEHAIAYDPSRQRTVVFGGRTRQWFPPLGWVYVLNADTWEWDGAAWIEATPVTVPTAMAGHAMVFDGNRQRVVMLRDPVWPHGPLRQWEWDGNDWSSTDLGPSQAESMAFDSIRGRTVMLVHDQTWEWDGAAWHRATTAVTPERTGHGTAFDVARQRTVVFGGSSGLGTAPGDTWTWNGSGWTQHAVAGPSPRARPALAYDPRRQRTVLYGGSNSTGLLSDTWEWDGIAWTQVVSSPSPAPHHGPTMAWDGVLQRVLLFGSPGPFLPASNEAWSWDGSAWMQLPLPASFVIAPHYLAHDAGRNRVVLLGLTNVAPLVNRPRSWDWDGATWTPSTGPLRVEPIAGDALGRVVGRTSLLTTALRATAQNAGSGCAGSGAEPTLSSNDPHFGNQAFALEALDTVANSACVFGLASDTAALPLGAGCTLLIDAPFSLAVAVANPSGVARTPTASVPAIAALAGVTLYAQALAFDSQAPLGFTMTARRTLIVGP